MGKTKNRKKPDLGFGRSPVLTTPTQKREHKLKVFNFMVCELVEEMENARSNSHIFADDKTIDSLIKSSLPRIREEAFEPYAPKDIEYLAAAIVKRTMEVVIGIFANFNQDKYCLVYSKYVMEICLPFIPKKYNTHEILASIKNIEKIMEEECFLTRWDEISDRVSTYY